MLVLEGGTLIDGHVHRCVPDIALGRGCARNMHSHLIEMCREEELTLQYAANHVKDPSVKTLVAELASDLLPHALVGSSDRAMIREAEHGEALALATYESALDDMLPPTARDVVERQRAEVRLAHDRVRAFLSH